MSDKKPLFGCGDLNGVRSAVEELYKRVELLESIAKKADKKATKKTTK